MKRDIIERLRDDWEMDSAASVPDAISEIQRLRKEVGRLKNEANRLRASMQAVIEEYDDSNPLAIVIEDMRLTLAQGKV